MVAAPRLHKEVNIATNKTDTKSVGRSDPPISPHGFIDCTRTTNFTALRFGARDSQVPLEDRPHSADLSRHQLQMVFRYCVLKFLEYLQSRFGDKIISLAPHCLQPHELAHKLLPTPTATKN